MGQIQGFVIGTDNPGGFYTRLLKKRWYRFAFACILPSIKNPTIIPRLIRAFSRNQEVDVHENCASLMSIAVDPEIQGQGIGKKLLDAFLSEVAKRDVELVNLTTDAIDNDAANQFYLKQKFKLYRSFRTTEGRLMNEYMIEL